MEAKDIISSGILELFATGLASPQEVKEVQEYVAQYPEVAEELSKIEADMETYANVFARQPDPSVKEKIFSVINGDVVNSTVGTNGPQRSTSSTIIGIPAYWKYAAAASIVLLLGSIIANIVMYNKNAETAKNLQQTQQQLAVVKQDNQEMAGDMQVVQNKYSRPVSLHGLDVAPDAAAKIFWIENTGELYIDPSNLPEAPAGKQYQLWGIVDGKPVDAGMIFTSKKGDRYRIQKMKSFGRAEAFAVSLESEKGNKAPKGPILVMGKM